MVKLFKCFFEFPLKLLIFQKKSSQTLFWHCLENPGLLFSHISFWLWQKIFYLLGLLLVWWVRHIFNKCCLTATIFNFSPPLEFLVPFSGICSVFIINQILSLPNFGLTQSFNKIFGQQSPFLRFLWI